MTGASSDPRDRGSSSSPSAVVLRTAPRYPGGHVSKQRDRFSKKDLRNGSIGTGGPRRGFTCALRTATGTISLVHKGLPRPPPREPVRLSPGGRAPFTRVADDEKGAMEATRYPATGYGIGRVCLQTPWN